MAKYRFAKDCKRFWKEVKNVDGSKTAASPSTMGGVGGEEAICDMWRKHYQTQTLLNSSTDRSRQEQVVQASMGECGEVQSIIVDTVGTRSVGNILFIVISELTSCC